jgi:flagella basal body P-ring formation protein FlgA
LVLKQNGAFTIRSGAHATLVMDEERAHIEVAVISLENGMAGQKIRVASPNHKQVYVAEVVSANLLKRSF